MVVSLRIHGAVSADALGPLRNVSPGTNLPMNAMNTRIRNERAKRTKHTRFGQTRICMISLIIFKIRRNPDEDQNYMCKLVAFWVVDGLRICVKYLFINEWW